MLGQILVILNNELEADEVAALSYDREIVYADDGERISDFDYFTIETSSGEYMEIKNRNPRFLKLQKLFEEQLDVVSGQVSSSIQLYGRV